MSHIGIYWYILVILVILVIANHHPQIRGFCAFLVFRDVFLVTNLTNDSEVQIANVVPRGIPWSYKAQHRAE